jgi:hypothetical protein
MKRSSLLLLGLTIACATCASYGGTDGSWSQTAGGPQDWANAGNWVGGILASGADASAIFNVNLTADQNVINAGGQTVGHLFFQDTTITAPNGGYNLGAVADIGSLTLDVTSGRSIIDIGTLDTANGKKISQIVPVINADGILKIGAGQYSIRAASPGITSDYVATAGLTDTRSALANLSSLQIISGAQFQVDYANAAVNSINLLNTALPITLGGTALVPPPAIPPTLPLTVNNPVTGGGTLTFTGRNASSNFQSVAGVTLNRGSHTINVTTGTASTNTFEPTSFTRNAGAVVNFNTLGSATNVLRAGGLVNDAAGIIGGWAINGTNWATVSGSQIAFLSSYTTSTDPTNTRQETGSSHNLAPAIV